MDEARGKFTLRQTIENQRKIKGKSKGESNKNQREIQGIRI